MLAIPAELLRDDLVQISNALADIDDEKNNAGCLDGEFDLLFSRDRDLFRGHLDLHTDTAGIKQHVVISHLGGNEVASDPGHIMHDGHALSAKPIKETAFPDIRAPD